MPRYVKQSDERWLHPTYRKAYCFKYRNGMVYTSVNSIRKATGYTWELKNRSQCLQILNKRVREIFNNSKYQNYSDKTIRDLVKQFHRDKVKNLDAKTVAQYKIVYRQFLTEDYLLEDVLRIREHIMHIKNTCQLSVNTMWKRLQRLKRIFDYAVELEWMDRNPVTNSMIPKFQKKEVLVCSKDHILAYIKYFSDNSNLAMAYLIEFAYLTAMRIQEILDIEWIDIQENYIIVKGKGKRKRVFVLKPFPRVQEIISKLKELKNTKPFPWKQQIQPGRYLRKANKYLNKQYENILDFTGITFHTFRKTAINNWRAAGIDSDTRNIIAGHSKDVEKGFYLTEPDIKYLESKLAILSKM